MSEKCDHNKKMTVNYNNKFTAKICLKCFKAFDIQLKEKKQVDKNKFKKDIYLRSLK
jgi:hypothetical protein